MLSLQPYACQVRRASLLLLDQPRGATGVPTAYRGDELCAWQQQQLDPTLDDVFDQKDAVYLLLALAKKYRFVVPELTPLDASPAAVPGSLAFRTTLVDEEMLKTPKIKAR